jgi:hypothetical protein
MPNTQPIFKEGDYVKPKGRKSDKQSKTGFYLAFVHSISNESKNFGKYETPMYLVCMEYIGSTVWEYFEGKDLILICPTFKK